MESRGERDLRRICQLLAGGLAPRGGDRFGLRAKGLRPFFDRRNLAPGLPWVRALEQTIGAAKAVIVLIGPRGLGNTQQYERELAFVRQTRDPAFPVVPVILPETTTDPPFDFLRVFTWIDFSHVARVSDAPDVLEQLLTAVQGGQPSAETVREAICPYRGIDEDRQEDSAFFFGRGSADDPKSPDLRAGPKVREPSLCDGGRPIRQRQVFAGLCRPAAALTTRARSVLECADLAARTNAAAGIGCRLQSAHGE